MKGSVVLLVKLSRAKIVVTIDIEYKLKIEIA